MSTPTEEITIQVPNAAVAESLQAYAQMHWSGAPDDAEYQRTNGTWTKCNRVPALFRRAATAAPESVWRPLRDGEVIKAGDEYQSVWDGQWKPRCEAIGQAFYDSFHAPTRRRVAPAEAPTGTIDPGAGYLLLAVGDVVQEGDEFQYSDGTWGQTECAGDKVGETPLTYRRRVAPAQAPTPEPGFRLLGPDEVLRGDDHYWSPNSKRWHSETVFSGYTVSCQLKTLPKGAAYARRVAPAQAPTPEPGFRLLGPDEVLRGDDHYWSPNSKRWHSETVFSGYTVSCQLKTLPKGAAYARRVAPAFTPGQTVEVLGGVPWCRNGNGEWVRDFSRPLLAGGEQYRQVTEDQGHAVLLDDGYEYPHSNLLAVQAKWRAWAPEEALGKQVYRKDNPKALMLVNEAHACGVFMWSSRKVLVYGVERVQYSRVYQSYEELLTNYEQLDGSPCGVLEGYEAL